MQIAEFDTIQEVASHLIIRLASNIQYMKDCLEIMDKIDFVKFNDCDESFVDQAEFLVHSTFDSSFIESNHSIERNIKAKPNMKITKETCQQSINLFFTVLMSQHFSLMNYQTRLQGTETKSEIFYQTKILKFNYRIFYKTTLHGNGGILKNLDKDFVEHLLSRLIRRGLLKRGSFINSEKSSISYESYLKILPSNIMEKKKFIVELNKHAITWEQYLEIYKLSRLSPYGTILTNDGRQATDQNDRCLFDINIQSSTSTLLSTSKSIVLNNLRDSSTNENDPRLNLRFDSLHEYSYNSIDSQISIQSKSNSSSSKKQSETNAKPIVYHQSESLNVLGQMYGDSSDEMEIDDNDNDLIDLSSKLSMKKSYKSQKNIRSTANEDYFSMDITSMENNSRTLNPIVNENKRGISNSIEELESYEEFSSGIRRYSTPDQSLQNQPKISSISRETQQIQQIRTTTTDLNEKQIDYSYDHNNDVSQSQTNTPSELSKIDTEKNEGSFLNEELGSSREQILKRCKQVLLWKMPIITKKDWNRHFGADSKLCTKVTSLLVNLGLLFQGEFARNSRQKYTCWLKALPNDPNNYTETLLFQQTKLNHFQITWQEYSNSFRNDQYSNKNSSIKISYEAANIIRSSSYRKVGFVLHDSLIFSNSTENINNSTMSISQKSSRNQSFSSSIQLELTSTFLLNKEPSNSKRSLNDQNENSNQSKTQRIR